MTMKKSVLIILLLTLLIPGLAACGGNEETPSQQQNSPEEANDPPAEEATEASASSEDSGDKALVNGMREAIDNLDKAVFSGQFQVATATNEGPVTGSVDFWKEKPGKLRVEFQSDRDDVNGLIAVSDGNQGWAYSPYENIVVISNKSQYRAQLRNQPELRVILEFTEELLDRGFSDTQVENQGTEQVNGRETQKVEVQYSESPDAELDLSGVTATYWIDPTTNLPHRMEVTIDRDGVTISGRFIVEGDIVTDQPIEASIFTFEPPAEAKVLDLSKLPAIPGISGGDAPDITTE